MKIDFEKAIDRIGHPEQGRERFREILEDVFNLMISLARESERASVILAVARIDSDLEKLLQHVLHPKQGNGDSLFDSERPLSAFSAKITMARRLGVIDREFESALQILRRIRNEFAHEIEASTLSSDRNRDRLADLVKLFENTDLYKSGLALGVGKRHENTAEQEQMLVCVACIVADLVISTSSMRRVYVGHPLKP
ncbi:hypothetical protein [Burkholderia gladioli]|uniref:hypothetical protein n=1 Tax=Burkholderia gladioli TaxID=28095 RepID=UPI00163F4DB8|nr:hypothetical protein [Burkholderia gladioli]